jgi:hypothetical protein
MELRRKQRPAGGRREKDSNSENYWTIPLIPHAGKHAVFGGYVVVFTSIQEKTRGTLNKRRLGSVFSKSCNDAIPMNVQ